MPRERRAPGGAAHRWSPGRSPDPPPSCRGRSRDNPRAGIAPTRSSRAGPSCVGPAYSMKWSFGQASRKRWGPSDAAGKALFRIGFLPPQELELLLLVRGRAGVQEPTRTSGRTHCAKENGAGRIVRFGDFPEKAEENVLSVRGQPDPRGRAHRCFGQGRGPSGRVRDRTGRAATAVPRTGEQNEYASPLGHRRQARRGRRPEARRPGSGAWPQPVTCGGQCHLDVVAP